MSLSIRSLAATAFAAVALVGVASLPATADGDHRGGHHHGHGPRAGVEISEVQYNARGIDTRFNRSLNGEWFTVRNEGRRPVQLRGYTVRDEQGHTYRFGRLVLGGGERVTVHTGFGRDGQRRVFQDSRRHLLDNRNGSITLRDERGHRLDRCNWNVWDGGHKSC